MSYIIKQVTNKKEWEDFLKTQEYALFTQSSLYCDVYTKTGEKSWIFGVYKGDVLVGGSLVTSVHAKRGNFLLLPYGPVLDYTNKEQFSSFITAITAFARKQKYDFVRLSPFVENSPEITRMFAEHTCRKSPMHVLAENTWILDLHKTEEQLFSDMKKNHRNLIRRCEREGVVIHKTKDTAAIQRLNSMHDIVAKRHQFHRFSKDFITQEFSVFAQNNNAEIFEATLPNGEVDSSAIILFYNNMACYRHSASLHKNKRLPTSYLIQWEVIKEAKKRGFRYYNFWGIAPKEAPAMHPFKGITHFKKGFGGVQKDLLPCQDIVLTKKYYFNWIVETIRRIKRGF